MTAKVMCFMYVHEYYAGQCITDSWDVH